MQLSICMLVLIMLYNSQYALPNTILYTLLYITSMPVYADNTRGQYTRNVHKMRPHVFKRGTKPWHTAYRDGRKVEVGYTIKPTVSCTYFGCESHGSSLWTSRKSLPPVTFVSVGQTDCYSHQNADIESWTRPLGFHRA